MEKTRYITINGFDFLITDELDYNNNHYALAIDEKGENTIAVLKEIEKDGEKRLVSVYDDSELNEVLTMFNKKNN